MPTLCTWRYVPDIVEGIAQLAKDARRTPHEQRKTAKVAKALVSGTRAFSMTVWIRSTASRLLT